MGSIQTSDGTSGQDSCNRTTGQIGIFYLASCPITIWPVVIGKMAKLASRPITTGQIGIGQLQKVLFFLPI